MHQITRFKDQPYIEEKVVGTLIGVLEQQIFSDLITASVMHYDVLPEARTGGWAVRLLKAFELWAKNRNAIEIALGVNSGDSDGRTAAFLTRFGYQQVGGNFVRTI